LQAPRSNRCANLLQRQQVGGDRLPTGELRRGCNLQETATHALQFAMRASRIAAIRPDSWILASARRVLDAPAEAS